MDDLTSRLAALKLKNAPKIMTFPFRDGGSMNVTIHKPKIRVRTAVEISGWPETRNDEVEDAVREWYARRGLPTPAADLEMCRQMREVEMATMAVMQTEVVEDPKPEFGTPEFWAWTRRRRAAINAERAAKGLPPLLTAAQKAKAKAQAQAQAQ